MQIRRETPIAPVGCAALAFVTIFTIAFVCVAAVQASAYDKSSGKSSDPAYLVVGNGVLMSTFTKNVPGIQGATHVVVLTSSGVGIGGWI